LFFLLTCSPQTVYTLTLSKFVPFLFLDIGYSLVYMYTY
jgi:hypothetical protein